MKSDSNGDSRQWIVTISKKVFSQLSKIGLNFMFHIPVDTYIKQVTLTFAGPNNARSELKSLESHRSTKGFFGSYQDKNEKGKLKYDSQIKLD